MDCDDICEGVGRMIYYVSLSYISHSAVLDLPRFLGAFGSASTGLFQFHFYLLQQRLKFGLFRSFASTETGELVGIDRFEIFEEIHFLGVWVGGWVVLG